MQHSAQLFSRFLPPSFQVLQICLFWWLLLHRCAALQMCCFITICFQIRVGVETTWHSDTLQRRIGSLVDTTMPSATFQRSFLIQVEKSNTVKKIRFPENMSTAADKIQEWLRRILQLLAKTEKSNFPTKENRVKFVSFVGFKSRHQKWSVNEDMLKAIK